MIDWEKAKQLDRESAERKENGTLTYEIWRDLFRHMRDATVTEGDILFEYAEWEWIQRLAAEEQAEVLTTSRLRCS